VRSSLPRYARLAEVPLVYEVSRRRSVFAIEAGFAGQLEAWLTDLVALTGWRAEQLWTYGTWTNGGSACSSWHNSGRAFDLARLRLADGTDVSCRYDLWRAASGGELAGARRAYWAVAASAHKHFAYVLTYLYNAQHHNHIHLDNGRSGAELARFSSRSPAQVQAVQGILGQLWDAPVEVSGRWDASTADAVRTVLADLSQGDDLSDQATWSGIPRRVHPTGRRTRLSIGTAHHLRAGCSTRGDGIPRLSRRSGLRSGSASARRTRRSRPGSPLSRTADRRPLRSGVA
jgi:hypothetical protein